jgi:hypothetical protein
MPRLEKLKLIKIQNFPFTLLFFSFNKAITVKVSFLARDREREFFLV